METANQTYLSIILGINGVSIAANLIINSLLKKSLGENPVLREITHYWLAVLGVFFLGGALQQNHFLIILAFSATIIPITFMCNISTIYLGGTKSSKRFNLFYLSLIPLTYVLYYLNLPFYITSLPVTLGTVYRLGKTAWFCFKKSQVEYMYLLKVYAAILMAAIFLQLSFPFIRLSLKGAIVGWSVAFLMYQLSSLTFWAILFEHINRTEKNRLEESVKNKTKELTRVNAFNSALLKTVLHDLSNPISLIINQTKMLQKLNLENEKSKRYTDKLNLTAAKMATSINDIRTVFLKQKVDMEMDFLLNDCFSELLDIYSDKLKEKSIPLHIFNQLPEDTRIKGSRTSFIHSVLSNMLSNAIKFSFHGESITLQARLEKNKVVILLSDQGIGMSKELIDKFCKTEVNISTLGTDGEVGTGLGLHQLRFYTEEMGGTLDVESKLKSLNSHNHGTKIKLGFTPYHLQ
ncbi:hypothetical protein A9Q84_16905 [Halobacteriovorax marinus]|uniref:histidine kinase n=1 Tax=Halobacteriovorax marinus TaxID=97084 RepID=A0A1Y5FB21_9BACT|nr:hypothetical protein A9Q84_16905 [Halobacteriovorax marinus]